LFILDGHGYHVTIKAIEQAQAFGLDMITLPSHTSHALQPLNVACFKPFKTTCKKKIHATMFDNNKTKLYKISLVSWVEKALNQSFTQKNIF
jgi:hypothetical protein